MVKKTKEDAILNAPMIKIVLCGPHTIYWVTKDAKLTTGLIKERILPQEIDHSKKIKSKPRKDEFLRSRWLFHKTIKNAEPLLPSATGYPKWPEMTLGSISHKDGHVILTKCSPLTHYSIGVDMEKLKVMKTGIDKKICDAEELLLIDQIMEDPFQNRHELLTMIFSIKESVFKSHFPLGKKRFDFQDVVVTGFNFSRNEIYLRLKVKTSNFTPKDHKMIGYYNWVECDGEKYVLTTTVETKPEIIEEKKLTDSKALDASSTQSAEAV